MQTQAECVEPHELVRLLSLVARRLRGERGVPEALQEAFRKGALGPRHMPVLFSLARKGPTSVGELARWLGLAPATVSLLLNALTGVGLVARREAERDRRRTIVSVPAPHSRRLKRLADERIALVQRTLERLDPEAREHFARGVRILAEESALLAGGGER